MKHHNLCQDWEHVNFIKTERCASRKFVFQLVCPTQLTCHILLLIFLLALLQSLFPRENGKQRLKEASCSKNKTNKNPTTERETKMNTLRHITYTSNCVVSFGNVNCRVKSALCSVYFSTLQFTTYVIPVFYLRFCNRKSKQSLPIA